MQRVLVAGETIIDFLPESIGPIDEVETFSRRAGGAPANVAVGLTRLDEPPAFWTRVGADPFGDFLADRLREEGVPDDYLERDPDAKTGLAFVSLDETADRGFSFYHDGAAETRMLPGAVRDDALAAADWVHVDGLSLDSQPSRDAIYDLADRAGDVDCTVSFDPNARPERWTEFDFSESVRTALAAVDVVKASPEDLAEIGITDEGVAAAHALTDLGPHTAFVTLGAAGAVGYATPAAPWVDGDEPVSVDHGGFDVDPVDTTGAGDAFTAGIVASLVDGESIEEAVAFANAVAAVATTAAGAMVALPGRDAVAAFRADHGE
jgi:fructokinase